MTVWDFFGGMAEFLESTDSPMIYKGFFLDKHFM